MNFRRESEEIKSAKKCTTQQTGGFVRRRGSVREKNFLTKGKASRADLKKTDLLPKRPPRFDKRWRPSVRGGIKNWILKSFSL